MSLFNNSEKLVNPAKKFIEFSAAENKSYFSYYDKEKKQTVILKPPFYIVPVDILSTVTGYHNKSKSGIWSREVRNTKTDALDVRTFGSKTHNTKSTIIAEGLWKDIEGVVVKAGGVFASSIYAVMLDKKMNPIELIHLKLSKSSLNAWIEAGVTYKSVSNGIVVKCEVDPELRTDAPIPFRVPKFTTMSAEKDLISTVLEVAAELPEYHKKYFNRTETTEESQEELVVPKDETPLINKATVLDEVEDDDLPF